MASKFMTQVSRWAAKVDIDIELLTKRTAFKVLSGAVERTPVDTGRARASWNMVASETADASVAPESYKKDGESARSEALNRADTRPSRVYTVSNNLDYIRFLEEGTSKTKPHHMAKLAVADAITELRINVR